MESDDESKLKLSLKISSFLFEMDIDFNIDTLWKIFLEKEIIISLTH